jgi:hypothetical protein
MLMFVTSKCIVVVNCMKFNDTIYFWKLMKIVIRDRCYDFQNIFAGKKITENGRFWVKTVLVNCAKIVQKLCKKWFLLKTPIFSPKIGKNRNISDNTYATLTLFHYRNIGVMDSTPMYDSPLASERGCPRSGMTN